jgi:hypothetical protein
MYREAGAEIAANAEETLRDAKVILVVNPPSPNELTHLSEGSILVGFLDPLSDPDLVSRLIDLKVTGISMELVPRITRAQSMDALSSQATVAGYKAVLLAANHLPKFLPMFTTAAGTIRPAKALILGAGVAGLQAIATARRLGAVAITAATGDLTVGVGYAAGDFVHSNSSSASTATADAQDVDNASAVTAGAKYVSGDMTFAIGMASGEGNDGTLGSVSSGSADTYDSLGASVDYVVAPGVTATFGYSDTEEKSNATATTASSGTSWYIGANISF